MSVSSGVSREPWWAWRALRTVFLSIEKLEVRCIHDRTVDTTKQTTQFVHIERLCLLSASLDTGCLGPQRSIQETTVVIYRLAGKHLHSNV